MRSHAAPNRCYHHQDDGVWEPFGGLASDSVAAVLSGRRAYTAEIDDTFVTLVLSRLKEAESSLKNNGVYDFGGTEVNE